METFTAWHTWADAEPGLRRRLPAEVVADLANAVRFAAAQHGDQQRKTGAPYLEHLLETLQVLVEGAEVSRRDVLVESFSPGVTSRLVRPSRNASAANISICERFASKPYGWKCAPITAAVSSSSASRHGVAYGKPCCASVKTWLAATNAAVRLFAIQGFFSQASRRITIKCCGGNAPVLRK